ncbi:MAG: sugar-transfer associated ATP-grasp domain-containing protein [Bacilli bacterium]|nr:sugar-transfer associated ATP-grasp domain-containing protein [Bacilli bacterium]
MGLKKIINKTITPIMMKLGASSLWYSSLKKRFFYKKYSLEMDELIAKYISYPITNKQRRYLKKDYLHFLWKYGGSIETDYFKTQMYRKSDFTRMESLANESRYAWRDSFQAKKYWPIFKDKRKFYESFSDELGRLWMIVDKDSKKEDFLKFIKKCDYNVFVKDPYGYGGSSVKFYKNLTIEESLKLFEELRMKDYSYIVEEQLKQCEELLSFSNCSVNTLRIITLVNTKGNPYVGYALLRMGSGKSDVDNFSSGGMAALVDVDTGILCTTAMNGKGEEFVFHPVTGKQIVGFKIPDWEKYKTFAIKLASYYPEMRYIGWDIIKDSNNNMCVIEGNKDAGVDLNECRLLYGLKPVYERILNL